MSAGQHARARRAVLLLATMGALISGYMTLTHGTHRPVLCAGLGSCATVQASEYATVAGVPVALLGLAMYVAIASLAAGAARPGCALALFGLSLCGMLYSGYLTWVELAMLHALCLWCAASAATVAAIAALAPLIVLLPPGGSPARQSAATGG